MLTKEEQDRVMEAVKRIIKMDRMRRTKIKTMLISEKSAKASEARDLEELLDLLKEIG